MSMHNTLVAGYAQLRLAEIDLEKMRNAGFDLRQWRIVTHQARRLPKRAGDTPAFASFADLELEMVGCIPEPDIVDLEAELDTGHLFLVAHGAPDAMEQARRIAETTHSTSWDGLADVTVYYGCDD